MVGERQSVGPLCGFWAGVGAVRTSTYAYGDADGLAGLSHRGFPSVDADTSDSEIGKAFICKFLQAWLPPRVITLPRIPTTDSSDVTILFFNTLSVIQKVTEGLGLAHCLHYLFAHGHGSFSSGLVQIGVGGGSSARPKGFQSPRGRDCASPSDIDPARMQFGVACPRFPGWQYATPTGVVRARVASNSWRANCVRGSSGKPH